MRKKLFYQNWKWWYYLSVLVLLATFLLLGLYFACFVDYWYIKPDETNYASLFNFDVLMSYLSVQVNIITIIWLIFMVFRYNAKHNYFLKNKMQTIVMNWNMLVFVIFWIGIIMTFTSGEEKLAAYPATQLACTIITHFVCQLLLVIVYFFEVGNQKFLYKEIYKHKEIYLTILYPLLYLAFVAFRAALYKNDQGFSALNDWHEYYTWPYPFLNFDDLLFGNSVTLYVILLILVFIIWLLINHLVLITINNWSYNLKIKQKNTTTHLFNDSSEQKKSL